MKVLCSLLFVLITCQNAWAYPTDAFERTKIRRLKWQHRVDRGEQWGRKTPPGAQWASEAIKLSLKDTNPYYFVTADTPKDPELQKALKGILKKYRWRRYFVGLLDISDPKNPRYAAVDELEDQTPGSVAKVLVAAALYEQLRARYPNDTAKREALLRETMVAADHWLMPNHHEVPFVLNPKRTVIRKLHKGDTFSLWEWIDHALSPSSNAAATLVWREAILMHLLGEEYPPAKRDKALFDRWDRETFTKAAFYVVDKPLKDAGISTEDFYIRMFFTRGAAKYINSEASRVKPLAILQWLIRLEQGKMIDAWSSLELKKMLYLTRRRVRYAKTKVLDDSGVYFKTGSLFACKPEPGYKCIQYEGNVLNVLNGMVMIETPEPTEEVADSAKPGKAAKKTEKPEDKEPPPPIVPTIKHRYLVAVMSNELKRNAATDHGRLAAAIHRALTGDTSEK